MVGEGVLHECLQHSSIDSVLVVNRRPCGIAHPKLKEILHDNFFDITPIADQLTGYDACYFCLGITSVGKKEPEYYRFTYTMTMHFAEVLSRNNDGLTFCYVSGAGTDSTEKGRQMWARVKGKTENDLMKLPFQSVYLFRPGYLHPTKGLKHTHSFYKYITWMYPVMKTFFPSAGSTLKELGLAMIHVTANGYGKQIIEVKDIRALAVNSYVSQ